MVKLETRPSLLKAIGEAVKRKQTAEEIEKQRISFIRSAVKGGLDLSDATIKKMLSARDGVVRR